MQENIFGEEGRLLGQHHDDLNNVSRDVRYRHYKDSIAHSIACVKKSNDQKTVPFKYPKTADDRQLLLQVVSSVDSEFTELEIVVDEIHCLRGHL